MRFDIFENIDLKDDAGGIEQVESISVVVNIIPLVRADRICLLGSLDLSVEYIDVDGESEEMIHDIPVEITIPADRVNNTEDLITGIKKLRVTPITRRSVRVTGVLELKGVSEVLPQAIVPTESAQAQAGGRKGSGGSHE